MSGLFSLESWSTVWTHRESFLLGLGNTLQTAVCALALAFIAAVSGSLGHLVMKALKRDRGVTSWGFQGMSVTGAGGLLDRVDALCFAAPIFFHSVRWYFGL